MTYFAVIALQAVGSNLLQFWKYFSECERLFGAESLKGITRDDSVICDTTHSKVLPFEGGEVSDHVLML